MPFSFPKFSIHTKIWKPPWNFSGYVPDCSAMQSYWKAIFKWQESLDNCFELWAEMQCVECLEEVGRPSTFGCNQKNFIAEK